MNRKKLKAIQAQDPLRQRLLDMGFLPGQEVEFFTRAPFKGPYVIRINNMFVALREEEMECLVWE